MNKITGRFLLVAALASFSGGLSAQTSHLFDFQPSTASPVTGYTQITRTTQYDDPSQSAGFSQNLAGDANRGTSWSFTGTPPASITGQPKALISTGVVETNAGFDFFFRDYVPANATSVDVTLYVGDAAAFFNPDFTTSVSFDGGSATNLSTGGTDTTLTHGRTDIGDPGIIYETITGSVNFGSTAVGGEALDIRFVDNAGTPFNDYFISGGVELDYTVVPEPSNLGLILGACLALFAVVRRKQRVV